MVTGDAPMLPGLESVDTDHSTPLERAVIETCQVLAGIGLIHPRDAARLALARTMARVIETKHRTGRMSTIGNDARVLMDLLAGLVPAEVGGDAEVQAAMDKWSAAIDSMIPS